jgi:signal transduction histidine kinase
MQKDLNEAKRLSDIGTLAATVAHELRNPLAAIRMASYNIKRKAQNPLLDKHLSNIQTKVTESDQIINNLLFYSRIKQPDLEELDLYKIMDECLEIAKKRAAGRKIRVIKKYRLLSRLLVEADSLQMKELFGNILNNSFDAIEHDAGVIEVGAAHEDKNLLKIYFKDTGSGMDTEHLKQVHEPFFTTKAKGTGLGLTVSHQIVNLHGGKIEFTSSKGTGTTVSVILPVKQSLS